MSAVGADRHSSDGVIMGTNVEKQLAGVNVDEAQHTILAQHTQCLLSQEQTSHTHNVEKR